MSQKMVLFITTAVGTSNPMCFCGRILSVIIFENFRAATVFAHIWQSSVLRVAEIPDFVHRLILT
jgi:hypothetical protein